MCSHDSFIYLFILFIRLFSCLVMNAAFQTHISYLIKLLKPEIFTSIFCLLPLLLNWNILKHITTKHRLLALTSPPCLWCTCASDLPLENTLFYRDTSGQKLHRDTFSIPLIPPSDSRRVYDARLVTCVQPTLDPFMSNGWIWHEHKK